MITKKEIAILKEMRGNARINLVELSNKVGLPVSTVAYKIKKLERGVIKKYVSLMDFSKLGFNIKVICLITPRVEQKSEIISFLLSNKQVNSIYKIDNRYDYLIECIFKTMGDLELFGDQLDNFVTEKEEHFVVENIKTERFLPL